MAKKKQEAFLTGAQIQRMLQERANQPKKYMRLNVHPDNVRAWLTDLMKQDEIPVYKLLAEDALNLVEWALARLPLQKEPKDNSEPSI